MDLIPAVILSIVEGITEFLPISSTGHLILTSQLLSLPQTEYLKTFEIAIQLGAILAVVVLFWKRLLTDKKSLLRVGWVFLPTAILGFILYKIIKAYLLGNVMVVIASLFFGGLAIIAIERHFQGRTGTRVIHQLTLRESLLLGVVQTLSVIPGVSRSATTIFGGMYLGLSREAATELSFLVAIPVMAAATGYDLLKSIDTFASSQLLALGFGIAVSFVVALLTVKWLMQYVKHHNFIYFGVYRMIVALLFLLFVTMQ
jgi:undecaprenyl-diphosphatase